jgi:hypothetical protein
MPSLNQLITDIKDEIDNDIKTIREADYGDYENELDDFLFSFISGEYSERWIKNRLDNDLNLYLEIEDMVINYLTEHKITYSRGGLGKLYNMFEYAVAYDYIHDNKKDWFKQQNKRKLKTTIKKGDAKYHKLG